MSRITLSKTKGRYGRSAAIALVAAGTALFGTGHVTGAPPRGNQVAKRVVGAQPGDQHPLLRALKIARASRETLKSVKDYQADFSKHEVIKGRLQTQRMRIKLRQQPFSVYLLFIKPHQGREVIYIDGRNDGKLLVHESGIKSLIGTLPLLPTGRQAMDGNRYPVTMIGMSNLLEQVIRQWEADMEYRDVRVKYYSQAKLGNRDCKVVQTMHPMPRPNVKFHMTRLYFDRSTNLPLRVEQYGFPRRVGDAPPLVEEYTYSNVRTNLNLKDIDFDVKNPNYDY